MTNLQATFEQVLKAEQISKKAFADSRNVDPSDVSRFINHGILSKPLLAKMFQGWSSDLPAIALLDSHLNDIAEASGLSIEVILKPKSIIT